ncbi:undecaprenyl-phosphate glucose phosphotransferase [Rhodanobacter sp. MP7CTX1]|uniref:undecaprenyl-phosphate glucose phosphotransferase n=1 Tax=Rhodanobacter sp. MP7CTX1 TaxID=2723084 RepID=UPI001617A130|nr:undecaprenyl-phosphate glucose phosphotransferase [Rhodanobacter sp. MP7CTX1]MBB6186546.1 Undecaprenyl-phosphate glucose phosphotransferase [Rhodanobacter sp. MP7CTX1]
MLLLTPGGSRAHSSGTTFFSKYAALLHMLIRMGDVVVVVLAAVVCNWARFATLTMERPYPGIVLRAVLLVLLIFPWFGLYRSWRGEGVGREIARLALALATVMVVLLISLWAVKGSDEYSRLWLGGWFAAALILLSVHRWVGRFLLGCIRRLGMDSRKVVLVGATQAGQKIIAAACNSPWMGLDIVGYVQTPYDQSAIEGIPLLGSLDTFIENLQQHAPDQIWVALPMRAEAEIKRLLEATSDLPSTIRLVPDMFGYELLNHQVTELGGVSVITLRGSRVTGHARIFKAIEDRALAAVILLLISPIMLLLAVGVKFSSPGPVFYRQRRVGLDGKEFEMLKFRSMPVNAEHKGVIWGNAKDKNVTRFGRFIRASSLDELPQFLNVLKGELSIVGPRPERPVFVEQFKSEIPGYMHKHLVKAGITGWAQIHGLRGDTDLTKRIELDLHYINHWSIWFDLKIILRTPFVLLKRTNAY